MSNFKKNATLFTFSTNLWYNKSPRAVSKKDGYVSLYLQIYIGVPGLSETEEIRMNLRWPPEKIDLKGSVLKPRFKGDQDVNDYNIIILSERSRHNEIAKVYRLSGKRLNLTYFKRDLRMFSYKESVISYMNKRRRELCLKGEIKQNTYMNVGCTIHSLIEYDPNVRFDQIDVKWISAFKSWLLIKKELRVSTVWTKIKTLKRYLKLADEEKFIYVDKDAIAFPNPDPPQNTIFLNRQEINRLIMLMDPLYLTTIEYNVLRAFIFTCFTSLRISDLYDAGKAMLIEENMLTFTANKGRTRTPKRVKIPLIPLVRSLIDETSKTFFKLPTEQEFNRTLKDLARKADINKNLTAHVGRHTFGYLWMTTSGNIFRLKEILGHSKLETTERYSHLDDEYNYSQALLMQKGFEEISQRGILRSADTI